MCGFVTIVTANGKCVESEILQRMTMLLDHRGPDDVGFATADPETGIIQTWESECARMRALEGILFGHKRLSIVDLTSAGHQPFVSEDRSMVLVYNGEIYNFLELRSELETFNVRFRTRTDTEVLLRAYQQWGTDALNKFNGMWAFALWDARYRQLVISRDRFGVKPLYYTTVDGAWVFSSEIKAVLGFPGAWRGFNDQRVMEFLASGLIDHTSETLFAKIQSVPPGSFFTLRNGDLRCRKFWTLKNRDRTKRKAEKEIIAEFRDLLIDSVRQRVRSDVPIGTMLSGGLDSTSITVLIHKQRLQGQSAETLFEGLRSFHHTFSACWPGWEDNEENEVDLIGRENGLAVNKVYPTAESIGSLLPRVSYFLDSPFESPIAIVQYLLMQEARKCGVKVVLNGHGSDELLGGYPASFVPVLLADSLLSGEFKRYLRERRAFSVTGEWNDKAVLTHFIKDLIPNRLRPWLEEKIRPMVQSDQSIFSENHRHHDATDYEKPMAYQGMSRLNRALFLMFSDRLLPKWLRMEDRMSMACSVESRLPFLDFRLVEYAFNLADDMKLRAGFTKYILRQAMQGDLPASIAWDRHKRRFALPYRQWLRSAWKPMMLDLFFSGPPHAEAYLNLTNFRAKLESFFAGNNAALDSRTVWRVLNTEIWMREFSGGFLVSSRSPSIH
jgi:asparagine synthase (glutamine-hydrolysing)